MEVECETCGERVDEGDCSYIKELDRQICDNCQDEADAKADYVRKDNEETNKGTN